MTHDNILDIPMRPGNGAGAGTLREYFAALVRVSMEEKRPFGNSDWHYELYEALIDAGLLKAELDEDGYIANVDWREADALIESAIVRLGQKE